MKAKITEMTQLNRESQPLDPTPIVRLSLPGSSPICWPCAEESGGTMREGHMATAWEDTCCVCGDLKSVVAVSDWGWPKQTKTQTGPKLKTAK